MRKYQQALSPTERRIAEMYAEGASYTEIASRTYRSPHTVKSHLKNVYRKIGVCSKIDLGKWLAKANGNIGNSATLVSDIQADLALYEATLNSAGGFDYADQFECADVFRDIRRRYPAFSGAVAGLSFVEGNLAFAALEEANAEERLASSRELGEKALSLNPFDSFAHFATARSMIFAGEFEKGEEHIRVALECDPDFQWAKYMLVFALTHSGKYAEAIRAGESILKEPIDDNIRDPLALTLACAHLQAQDKRRACAISRELLRRKRTNCCIIHTACLILAEANRRTEVEEFANSRPLEAWPKSALQHRLHARDETTFAAMMRQQKWLESLPQPKNG